MDRLPYIVTALVLNTSDVSMAWMTLDPADRTADDWPDTIRLPLPLAEVPSHPIGSTVFLSLDHADEPRIRAVTDDSSLTFHDGFVQLPRCTRFEVILSGSDTPYRWLDVSVRLSLQDDGRTLKAFLS